MHQVSLNTTPVNIFQDWKGSARAQSVRACSAREARASEGICLTKSIHLPLRVCPEMLPTSRSEARPEQVACAVTSQSPDGPEPHRPDMGAAWEEPRPDCGKHETLRAEREALRCSRSNRCEEVLVQQQNQSSTR